MPPQSESESSLLPLPLLPIPFRVATRAFCCFRDMRRVSMMRGGAEGEDEEALLLSSPLLFLGAAATTTTRADSGL